MKASWSALGGRWSRTKLLLNRSWPLLKASWSALGSSWRLYRGFRVQGNSSPLAPVHGIPCTALQFLKTLPETYLPVQGIPCTGHQRRGPAAGGRSRWGGDIGVYTSIRPPSFQRRSCRERSDMEGAFGFHFVSLILRSPKLQAKLLIYYTSILV